MKRPLEDPIRFVVTGPDLPVHVLAADEPPPTAEHEVSTGSFAETLTGLAVNGWPAGLTRCGVTIRLDRGGDGISEFADERLCVRCYRTVRPDEQYRLFEFRDEPEEAS